MSQCRLILPSRYVSKFGNFVYATYARIPISGDLVWVDGIAEALMVDRVDLLPIVPNLEVVAALKLIIPTTGGCSRQPC